MKWLLDALPMLILVAVWLYIMSRMGLGIFKKGGAFSYYKNQAEQTEQLKRQTEILERIAVALEQHRPPNT